MKSFIGFLATILTVVTLFPQISKVLKTKSTHDLSFWSYFILSIAAILWVVYGLILKDIAIIFTNSIVAITSTTLLFLKKRLG